MTLHCYRRIATLVSTSLFGCRYHDGERVPVVSTAFVAIPAASYDSATLGNTGLGLRSTCQCLPSIESVGQEL